MTNPVTQKAYLVANGSGTIFPTVVFAKAPAVSDFNYPITQRWIDTSDHNAEWFLLGFTSTAGVVSPNWVQLASGAQTTETLTGNTGGPVGPDVSLNTNIIGNIVSGISIAGNPATSTLTATLANIPNASLANSSISLVAGTGISITVSPVSLGGATTISSTATLVSFNQVIVQVFTTPGAATYTPTTGMKYCTIEVVGGGGGGGGIAGQSATHSLGAGGGGAGGYARKTVAAAVIGVSKSITVGAGGAGGLAGVNTGTPGGTTSVGATIVQATGGAGGPGAPDGVGGIIGGVGGVGSLGDINVNGSPGGIGFGAFVVGNASLNISGNGGSSIFGGGGYGVSAVGGNSLVGINATLYGSGGGGATSGNSGTQQAGGNGSSGIIIITEFISV